ncbi:glycosyltransferase family 2 protein [Shimia thalassica]|uniref:glycosyltransferase family 2 protein n=1 Tax=Shimia thalassica TaxID=1715693 RepID=UPI002732B1D8|nr:glycosyltransferase family 2 protein [Shimia thalassica]MDP2580181.1 glycosyltransferase family 2 protein [Shimia thalassica]
MQSDRAAVFSCMRNEGPFIMEWVAYHHAIGFDTIAVATNNCTDGSDRMLDRLAELGHVIHIDNQLEEGEAPQRAGLRRALAHPDIGTCAWLLHIDADEFLNVTAGEGFVSDLLAVSEDAEAIAILWRSFGHNGLGYWNGGSVLNAFTRAQGRPMKRSIAHKTMFRPDRFGSAIDHMPKEPVSDNPVLINTAGEHVYNRALRNPSRARYRMGFEACTWENANINHYAIKSQDIFLMKNDRGDGMAATRNKYFLNSVFYFRHNRNDVEEKGILRHWPATEAILNEMRSDPELVELEKAALDAYRTRRDQVLTPERILEWSLPPRK